MQIIKHLLDLLKIKHSNVFIVENYANNHNAGNLLGIQNILYMYGIESVGIKFEDKINANITLPCICHMNNHFVIVQKLEDGNVFYIDNKHLKIMSESEFCEEWNGVALLISNTSKAGEPHYYLNKIKDLYINLKYHFLIFFLFCCTGVLLGSYYNNIILTANVIFNILGLITSLLICQKFLGQHNVVVDRICSLINNGDCESILKSKESKFLNIFSWSEIGLAYFITNILFLIISHSNLFVIQLFNWFAMPYGIWSFWFQIFYKKNICLLCCVTQLIIWAIGLLNIIYIQPYSSLLYHILYIAFFSCSLILINIVLNYQLIQTKYLREYRKLLHIKSDTNIFYAIMQNQKQISVSKENSRIFFGNKEAKNTITIVINPHCDHCAQAHIFVTNLLKTNNNIKVQYIFTEFSKEQYNSILSLIAIYFQKDYDVALSAFSDWFSYKNVNYKNYISKYNLNIDDKQVLHEYNMHSSWIHTNNIPSTPYIIYNKKLLPSFYEIEDLEYLLI